MQSEVLPLPTVSGESLRPQVKSLVSILEVGWVKPLSSVAHLRLVDVPISLTLHKQVSILCQGHYPAAPTALGAQQGAASRKCIKDESAREKGPLGQLPASQLFILHNFQQITGCLLVLIYN